MATILPIDLEWRQVLRLRELTASELAAMDTVIAELGGLNAQEISARMHAEEAYQRTERGKHISFELVKSLSIS